MKEADFSKAIEDEYKKYIVNPYNEIPMTKLVEGSYSHLVFGENSMISFLTMKAGSVFELHSHPEEQIMIVLEGYCDEIIEDKIYRVKAGDVIHLPPNIKHGAFLRDVDCKAIDIFSPPRKDYFEKNRQQFPDYYIHFNKDI